ncbi:MAG: diguanylate cyclase [Actinomycetota bacterium]|nr:diguanylate cyclase [Actinomycetota bacterium]
MVNLKIEDLNKEISGMDVDAEYGSTSFGGILLYNKGKIIELNEQMVLLLGYDNKRELTGQYVKDIFTLESYNLAIKNSIFGHERCYELDCIKKDNSIIKCKICTKLINHNGTTIGIVAGREIKIPDSKFLSRRIKHDKYTSLFENSLDGIYMADMNGKFIDTNPALIKIMGYDNKEELLLTSVPDKFYTSHDDDIFLSNNVINETIISKKDGSMINVEINSSVIYEKTKPAYIQGIVRDITERKRAEEKIRFLSFHDSLTSLYNRSFFEDQIRRLDTQRQLPLSIIIGDVNGLKLINDTFGHKEGDALLYECANILKKCCRQEDFIFRWGGDEFSVILPQTGEEIAEIVIERIRECCRETGGHKIPISISLGYSIKKSIDQDINALVKNAEDMMYTNKLMESKSISSSIFSSLKRTLYEKSVETENHGERLKGMVLELGKLVGLSDRKLSELVLLASLHDIGKIAIPEPILKKEDNLSAEEWEMIKKHPEIGYRILLSSPQLSPISKGVLYHHEKWNGTGYPEGLIGEDIPITARIISIVDAYDVMRNGRPYKKPMSRKQAVKELIRCSGTQFDPNLVRNFLKIIS